MSEVPLLARGACRWQSAVEHLAETDTAQARKVVVCCGCRARTEHQYSWASVPYGRNGVRLPLAVYLFCTVCRHSKDATEEWQKAHRAVPNLMAGWTP